MNGINYRADKELVRETNLRCDLRRGGISRVWKSPFTEEERRTRALDYLHEHPFLRIQDYMAITGLKRSSANRELLRLSSDPASGLTISGYGSHRGVCPQENRGRSLIHPMVPRAEKTTYILLRLLTKHLYCFSNSATIDFKLGLSSRIIIAA